MFLKKLYKSVDNAMKRQLRKGLPFVSFRSDELQHLQGVGSILE